MTAPTLALSAGIDASLNKPPRAGPPHRDGAVALQLAGLRTVGLAALGGSTAGEF